MSLCKLCFSQSSMAVTLRQSCLIYHDIPLYTMAFFCWSWHKLLHFILTIYTLHTQLENETNLKNILFLNHFWIILDLRVEIFSRREDPCTNKVIFYTAWKIIYWSSDMQPYAHYLLLIFPCYTPTEIKEKCVWLESKNSVNTSRFEIKDRLQGGQEYE